MFIEIARKKSAYDILNDKCVVTVIFFSDFFVTPLKYGISALCVGVDIIKQVTACNVSYCKRNERLFLLHVSF